MHRLARHMRTGKIVEHRMVGPFDGLVRIVAVDLDPVQIADMLHVGRVGAQHPRIDRHFLAEDQGLVDQIFVRILKIGQLVMRFQSVERPKDAVFLAGRECEQPCRAGDRILARHAAAAAVPAVFPVMVDAAYLAIDHVADRQVGTHVRTISAHHVRLAFLVAEGDDAAVEKIEAADEVRRRRARHADRIPALRERAALPLERHRLAERAAEGLERHLRIISRHGLRFLGQGYDGMMMSPDAPWRYPFFRLGRGTPRGADRGLSERAA